jgi:tRNA (cytidine/uridine-2'-O-)-methyltransferase
MIHSPAIDNGQAVSTVFHVILYEPEIPPNTGNVIRLCANTGSQLHLVEPLGFRLEDSKLQCLESLAGARVFACSTRGGRRYTEAAFRPGDALLFGPETRGLPDEVLDRLPAGRRLRIPMAPGNRSLNLSNAVAVVVYRAWAQQDFAGGR